MADNQSAGYGELFWTFAKIGVMTFGGGIAMLPILQREVVENKGWASEEELADYYAIGQCTPGIIAVNTATFIGHKTRGAAGGIIATMGIILPSFLIITVLARLITNFADFPVVKKAFAGIRVCVCVLIFNAICKLWKSSVKGKLTFLIFLIVAGATVLTDLSPALFVIGAAVLGVLLQLFSGRNGEKVREK